MPKVEKDHTGAPLTAPTVETEGAMAVLYSESCRDRASKCSTSLMRLAEITIKNKDF